MRRAVALVSHVFTVPLDEALDMDMGELEEWVDEAVDLHKRLYCPPRKP